MSLFNAGNFKLHSGASTKFKIDADWLDNDDIYALCKYIKLVVPPFKNVIAIPSGGSRLADELKKYTDPKSVITLLADDVYSTGTSMNEYKNLINGPVTGVVLFARTNTPAWIYPLFQMTDSLLEYK